jgi:hypothetical protein
MPEFKDLRNLLNEEADAASRGEQRPLISVVDLSVPSKPKQYKSPFSFKDKLVMLLDKVLTRLGV